MHLLAGLALRALGRAAEARAALERAQALDASDHACAFELGALAEAEGRREHALELYRRAAELRPAFLPARFAAGTLLAALGRRDEAMATIEAALAEQPNHPLGLHAKGQVLLATGAAAQAAPLLATAAASAPTEARWQLDAAHAFAQLRHDAAARDHFERALAANRGYAEAWAAYGRFCVARGEFAAASQRFAEACRCDPANDVYPIYLAQAQLVQGQWAAGWSAYARREPRRRFQAACAARGVDYTVPPLDAFEGREVTLLAEQGLGDILFYLRFAPALAQRASVLHFVGDARLHPLLMRTALFDTLRPGLPESECGNAHALLTGDLPAVRGMPDTPASLRITPDAARVAAWHARLQAAGPRPWIGVTWRAGTPSDASAHGLYKTVPFEAFFTAIAALGGTAFALQRLPREGEIAAAGAVLGRTLHDASAMNDDLDDALALVSVLDRHIGVSNTNMHLGAAAGATADVLVPFPPEWRWGTAGDSIWYPGFRVLRQAVDGDWSDALARIA